MHINWDMTIGQLAISVPLLWVLVYLMRIYSLLLRFRMEHEILMRDWADRTGNKLEDLSTRQKGWW